jgi:MarR family transcriptional regulator for hemolysin
MSHERSKALAVFTRDLIRLARVYRREVDRSARVLGVSDARAVPVLHIARAGGGMRQGVLAEELGIEGPSLVRLLDQICAAGLVERRDDPSDGRAKTLHITTAGLELAGAIEDLLTGLRTRLFAQVSDEDLAASLRAFAALETALSAAEAEARGH